MMPSGSLEPEASKEQSRAVQSTVAVAVGGWFGLFVPAGTAPAIVSRLHADATQVLRSPDLLQRLNQMGVSPGQMSQAEFASFVAAEIDRWTSVVREAGIKAE